MDLMGILIVFIVILILGVVLLFILFMRHIERKEEAAIKQLTRPADREVPHGTV